jgi:zona occludens toxin
MALVLFTGVPGMGKTAHIVSLLLDEANKGRKIFVSGIPDLQIIHEQAGDISTWHQGDWLKINRYDPLNENQEGWQARNKMYELQPDPFDPSKFIKVEVDRPLDLDAAGNPIPDDPVDCGALLVIDECQRFFRPRPAGSKVPEFVQALEVHRKQGLDIWLISQRPGQVDSHVRGLCEKHYGIWANWLGRYMYEWSIVSNIDSKSDRDTAKKSRFTPPKRAFPYYKSAEVHADALKHRFPFMVKFLIFIVILMVGFAGRAYFSYTSHGKPVEPLPVASGVVSSAQIAALAGVNPSFPASSTPATVAMNIELARWVPVVPSRPETAPAFDDLRKVSVMPIVSACLRSASRCTCYSQQGTRLDAVNEDRCNQLVDGGKSFNPYQAPAGRGVGDSVSGGAPTLGTPSAVLPLKPPAA